MTLIGRRKILQYGDPQLSRQNQKPRGKNKIPHGKTKNITDRTKYLTAKRDDTKNGCVAD